MSIEEKKRIRKARPAFIRSEGGQIKRISRSGYRRPKGLHNKMKDSKRGNRRTISVGFGYPKETRYRDLQGRLLVHVSSIEALQDVPKDGVAIIASSLGTRKKIAVLEKAAELKIPVYTVADPLKKAKQLKEDVVARKKNTTAKKSAREIEKQKALDKKSGKKKKADSTEKTAPADSKEAKDEQKRQQEKVLMNKE